MSNFWEGFDAKPIKNNIWDGFNTRPVENNATPTLGNRIASGAKSLVAGAVGGIADTAALAYNIPAAIHNARARQNQSQPSDVKELYNKLATVDPRYAAYTNTQELPLIPSAKTAISKGIDTVTGGYTKTPEDQKDLNTALEFGTEVASGGGLKKVAEKAGKAGIAKLAGYFGTTNPWAVGGAATAGGVMSNLEDKGASTAETLGTGVAVNLGVANAPGIAKGIARGAFSAVGLGKKNLNVEAAKAASDLDIALPKAAASDSKLIALADQFLGKAPVAGEVLQKRYKTLGERVLKNLDEVYDSVISTKELEGVNERISLLYDKSRELLPKEAVIVPNNTISKVNEIKNSIKSASPSADEKALLQEISNMEEFFTPSGIKGVSAQVEYLVGTKKSLNSTIRWDMDEGVKNRLREIQHALQNDIAEYGKKNKDWYDYYAGADKLYARVAKREQLEQLLGGKFVNSANDQFSYNNLSKVLNTEKSANQLKKLVEPEVYKKLEKLGTVAKALAKKNVNIPNPSGTAPTQKILYALTGAAAGTYDPITTGFTLIGATGIAHLLTDKKSLDAAIRLIETGDKAAAVTFNRRMKEITGYTPITLLREINKEESQKQVAE